MLKNYVNSKWWGKMAKKHEKMAKKHEKTGKNGGK